MNDKLVEIINSNKEVLSSLPKNNLKNRKKYVESVDNLISEFSIYKDNVYKEMKSRFDNIMGIDKISEIVPINNEIGDMYSYLDIFSPYESSYEKSGLDRILYDLGHYNDLNLDSVNSNINKAISVFGKIGIQISADSFTYSGYVHDYIEVLLNNKDSNVIKDKFNNIYWKCSDIIIHIELNFKYLYLKNKKIFDNYFSSCMKDISLKYNNSDILSIYKDKIIKRDNLYKKDIYTIIRDFISKKYNINDYEEDKINKIYDSLITITRDKDNINEVNNNILNLYNSLVEYKSYNNYLDFINNVREVYKDKDKYKNVLKNKYKDISKLEKKLFGLNKKINRAIRFKKSEAVIEKLNININNIILDIKKLYDEVDIDKINELIISFDDNASIYDMLYLIYSNYIYLRYLLGLNNEDVSSSEVNDNYLKLRDFVFSPYNNLIDNISIFDTKDVSSIVCDRYKLINFNINIDSLDMGNIDSVIDSAFKILMYNNILNSDVNVLDILFVCEVNNLESDS